MALSTKTRKRVEVALARRDAATELCNAIDAGGNTPGAAVALLGTTTDLVGVDGTGSNAAPLVGTESRLDAIEAKVDALITSLKNAGYLA